MEKIDLKKKLANLYGYKKTEPALLDVPSLKFVQFDGHGNPNNNPMFEEAMQVVYTMAYGIKFKIKSKFNKDYTVMPPEGLWCADDMTAYNELRKDEWKWTIGILIPDEVTPEIFEEVKGETIKKKKLESLKKARFDVMNEGKCAQILHLGPYADEQPTIAKLHKFIFDSGYHLTGRHREIYLSDPRRCAPEKMKTIIRQPIRKK